MVIGPEPLYLHPHHAPNAPVTLHEGVICLRDGHTECRGVGKVVLRFLPSTDLDLAVDVESGTVPRPGVRLQAEVAGGCAETLVHSVRYSSNQATHVEASLSRIGTGNPSDLTSVGFQVLNFLDFLTPGSKVTPAFGYPPMIGTMEAGGWRVRLSAVKRSKEVFESLKEAGGYAFTHVGLLERADSAPFNASAASAFLDVVAVFLSFAKGAACASPIRWGKDAADEVVWQSWGSPVVDPWKPSDTWFDEHHGNLLNEVFPAFHDASVDPETSAPFRLALHWYQRCNMRAGGMEGAIILGVTNLDLLAALVVVDRVGAMSDSKFDSLPAAKKLSHLLAEMSVPPTFPGRASELAVFAAANSWTDTPQTLAEIRHGYVHASKKRRKVVLAAPRHATFYAWQLALWYQELALLHFLTHRGEYRNRMTAEWRGEVEKMPWV